jgi:hypothetical protein
MPGPDSYPIKSPSQSHVAGSTLRFHSWVPRRGPSGGRNVIDGFEITIDVADLDVSVAAIEGADLWRFFKRIQIEQAGGQLRWNLRGDESRAACYLLEGPDRIREFADAAIAADQVVKFSVYIPMERRYAVEPRDFSLAAELLSEIRIECTDVTEFTGSTVVMTGASYYVTAWCHEEFSVRICPYDVVSAMAFPSTTGLQLPVAGRLHDLLFYARGTAGGASVANFTDTRIDYLIPVALARTDTLGQYQRDRRNSSNLASADGSLVRMDPFLSSKAVPVLWCTERTSVFDGPLLDQAIINVTNSVASLLAINRVVKPRDPSIVAAVMDRHGLKEESFRVKTKGKSKRGREKWSPEQEAFMPLVAPLYR